MLPVQAAPAPTRMVAVCHDVAPDDFVRRLRALGSRHGRVLSGAVVCNGPRPGPDARVDGIEWLRGSNRHLDFSGYFEGIDRLLRARPGEEAGNVLFVNDSLLTRHAAGTILGRVLALDRLLAAMPIPAIAGKMEPYRSICLRNPWSGDSHYMSSFCFMLNSSAVPLLGRLPEQARNDGVLADVSLGDAGWAAGLAPSLREQIRSHLLYPGSPYRWRHAESSDEGLLQRKAHCVYFEQRLSGEVGKLGALVAINAGPRSRSIIAVAEAAARAARALSLR